MLYLCDDFCVHGRRGSYTLIQGRGFMITQEAVCTLESMVEVVQEMVKCPTFLGREEQLRKFRQLAELMGDSLEWFALVEKNALVMVEQLAGMQAALDRLNRMITETN